MRTRNLIFLGALLFSARAFADSVPVTKPSQAQSELNKEGTTAADRPWARSISAETQKAANALFRDGNGLLKDSLFVQASKKYREALAVWDHPAIHYNLALALLNLDQPLEVYSQLEEALKYGAAPLDTDKFDHAMRYKTLIEKQLARVEISCTQQGATVTMDGKEILVAPGKYEGIVRAGQHAILATKAGFESVSKSQELPGGQKTRIDLVLYTNEELTLYKRRWDTWKPWAVVAAGIVVAAVGGILQFEAYEKYRGFDAGVQGCGGCVPDTALAEKRTAGDQFQAGAIAAYSVGGAIVATGIILVGLNRAQPYRINREHPKEPSATVSPFAMRGGGGLGATLHF
jgi:hypothetical protein